MSASALTTNPLHSKALTASRSTPDRPGPASTSDAGPGRVSGGQAAGPIPYQGKSDTGPDQAETDKCEKSPRGPATGELLFFCVWFFRWGVVLYVLFIGFGVGAWLEKFPENFLVGCGSG